MNRHFQRLATSLLAFAGLALLCAASQAQDDVPALAPPIRHTVEPLHEAVDVLVALSQADPEDAANDQEVANDLETEYWLGVQVMAVPELAKQQLSIERGLAVGEVVPDSPAAKADIRPFDILTKVDDQELENLDDLVEAVEASKGKEITIKILRAGQPQTAKATAAKRPAGTRRAEVRVLAKPEIAEEIRRVEEALQKLKAKSGDGGINFYIPRPGVVAPRAEVHRAWSALFGDPAKVKFPSDLSIRVTKDGDQPAKIHVQRKDKEWDVTEDTLSELPDDIRPHVERYVGRGLPFPWPGGQFNHERRLRVTPDGKVEGELHVRPNPPLPPVPPAMPRPPARPRRPGGGDFGDEYAPAPADAHRLDAIHKELRELRKEVEELRKAPRQD
jgi:hypothetical protein